MSVTKTPTIVLVDEDDFCGSVGGALMLPLAVALSLLSTMLAPLSLYMSSLFASPVSSTALSGFVGSIVSAVDVAGVVVTAIVSVAAVFVGDDVGVADAVVAGVTVMAMVVVVAAAVVVVVAVAVVTVSVLVVVVVVVVVVVGILAVVVIVVVVVALNVVAVVVGSSPTLASA